MSLSSSKNNSLSIRDAEEHSNLTSGPDVKQNDTSDRGSHLSLHDLVPAVVFSPSTHSTSCASDPHSATRAEYPGAGSTPKENDSHLIQETPQSQSEELLNNGGFSRRRTHDEGSCSSSTASSNTICPGSASGGNPDRRSWRNSKRSSHICSSTTTTTGSTHSDRSRHCSSRATSRSSTSKSTTESSSESDSGYSEEEEEAENEEDPISCVPLPVPTASYLPSPINPGLLGRRNAVCALSHDPEKEEYHRRVIEKSVEEREQLRSLLLQNPLFSYLDEESLDTAVDAMKVEKRQKGYLVFEQGKEPAPKLFVVLYGDCKCTRNGKLLRSIGPGGYFGELELMYQQKSSVATVECMSDSTFFTLHRDHYQHLMHRRCLEQRNRFKQYIDTVPFLQKVPEYDRLRMADALSVKVYSAGELIIAYGQRCQELFFLMEGKTRVLGRSQDGVPMEIVVQEPGSVIGELEFLFEHNAVADVIVITPEAKVARISRHHFEAIMGPVQSCLLSFIAEVPVYDSYLNRVPNRKAHDEVLRLREKAKALQDKCKARSVKSKARSIASREKNLPLDFGMPTSPIEEVQGSVSTTGVASRWPAAADDGGRLEELINQLGEEGSYVVRLPPNLLYYTEISVTPKTTPLKPSGLPRFQGNSPLAESPNRAALYESASVSPSMEGLAAGGMHGGITGTPFAYCPMSDVLHASGLVLFCLREDGTVLSWHEKLEDLTGYPSSDAIGQSLYAFLQSEREQLHLQHTIRNLLSHGITENYLSLLGSTAVDMRSRSCNTPATSNQSTTTSLKKRLNTEKINDYFVYHFSRQDGITHVRIQLKVIIPKVELHISPDLSSHRVVMVIGKEHTTPPNHFHSDSLDPSHLLRQIRSTLADGSVDYEERLFAIADFIENYETIQRAHDVSKEGWQPVQLRQLIGKVIMDCVSDCVENGHIIHQRFENLTCEEACVDVTRLPRVLKHTMRIATHYTKNAEVTITLSIREHAGMEFLAFIFSCDVAHLSPALEELVKEIESRRTKGGTVTHESSPGPSPPAPASGSNQRLGTSGMIPSSPVDLGESFVNNDMLMGGLEMSHRLGSGVGMTFSCSQSNLLPGSEFITPRFRKHLRGIRHAIEQQGGTIRSTREGEVCHLMYLLPFIPAEESTFSPPRADDVNNAMSNNYARASGPTGAEAAIIPLARLASPLRENPMVTASSPSGRGGQPGSPPFFQSSVDGTGRSASGAAAPSTITSAPDDFGKDRLSFGEDGWSTNLAPAQADIILAQKKKNKDRWRSGATSGNDSSEVVLPSSPQMASCLTAAVNYNNMNSSLSLGIAPFSPFQNSPLHPTDASLAQALSYTTLVAEENLVQRNLLCKYLWQRKHAVLSATTFSEVERLSESVDILIIDVLQYTLQSSSTINFLQEKTHQLSIVVTGEMDEASRDAYIGAGFFVMPKPVHPSDFRAVMSKAEGKIIAFKRDAQSISMIRRALGGFRMTSWDRGELLGKGTHGEVYKATSTITGGVMAVKEMRVGKNSDKLEEILTEISTMCSLQHPNIIHYFSCELSSEAAMVTNPLPAVQLTTASPSPPPAPGSVDSSEGIKNKSRLLMKTDSSSSSSPSVNRYLRVFMEYAAGGALRDYLAKNGKLEFKLFQSLLHNVVSGLAYIHANHYVHGDIKTANILLTAQQVGKIGDFGSARRVLPGELLYNMEGSLTYMSPECLSAGEIGENGRRIGFSFPTDIWSLGVVAMEMITNSPPYSHVKTVTGPATLTQYLTSLKSDTPDLSPLFEYPPCVTEFIAACLHVVPSQRATAEDLLHYSIFHEGTDVETTSALKALRQAELRHIMSQYVAFQEPKEQFSMNANQAVPNGELKSGFAFKKNDDMDDFFDSDTTEEEDDDDNDSSGPLDNEMARNDNNEGSVAALPVSRHHDPSSHPSVLSEGGFFSSELNPQGKPFPFYGSVHLPGHQEMDVHSHTNTPVVRQPSAAMPGGIVNEGSSGDFFVGGTASQRQQQKTPPPGRHRRTSYIVEDVREFPSMQRVESNLKDLVHREQSVQFRGGSSLRDSVGPTNMSSFAKLRNNFRPSKITTLMNTVAATMENAADEILTALIRPQKSAFPSTSVSETHTEVNGAIQPNTGFHNRVHSSIEPATPCTPVLPTNHTLTLANLNNLAAHSSQSKSSPKDISFPVEGSPNTTTPANDAPNQPPSTDPNRGVEAPRMADALDVTPPMAPRDKIAQLHSSSYSPQVTHANISRVGETDGGTSLPMSFDIGTADQSSRMSTNVLLRAGGSSGHQLNGGSWNRSSDRFNDPGASQSVFGSFPISMEVGVPAVFRSTSPSNLFRAHHRVLQRRRTEAVYVAPAPRGQRSSSLVDDMDAFRASRNGLQSAELSFVGTPLATKVEGGARQNGPRLPRQSREFDSRKGEILGDSAVDPVRTCVPSERFNASDPSTEHYGPSKPSFTHLETLIDRADGASGFSSGNRMGALLDDIQGLLNHLRVKETSTTTYLQKQTSQGTFAHHHTTPQLLHPSRRYSSMLDSAQTSGTMEDNHGRRNSHVSPPALFTRSLGSEEGCTSRRNSLNGRPPLCRADSGNSSRIAAASSLPGGYLGGGYETSTFSENSGGDTAVVGILQDFQSALRNIVTTIPSSTSRHTPAFRADESEGQGLSPHRKQMGVSATTAIPVENEDSPLVQPLRTLAHFRPTSSEFYPDAMSI